MQLGRGDCFKLQQSAEYFKVWLLALVKLLKRRIIGKLLNKRLNFYFVCIALEGLKEVPDLQELELETVVTHTVGAGDQSRPLEEPTLLPTEPSCQHSSLG